MRQLLTYLAAWCCILSAGAWNWKDKGVSLSGSIQSEMLVPRWDEATGAEKTGDFLTNTYADLLLQSKYVDAGARLEFLQYPLPGFEKSTPCLLATLLINS